MESFRDAAADTASWKLYSGEPGSRKERFACHGPTWDAQRKGRHNSTTQYSSQNLRNKGLQVIQLLPGAGTSLPQG